MEAVSGPESHGIVCQLLGLNLETASYMPKVNSTNIKVIEAIVQRGALCRYKDFDFKLRAIHLISNR